MKAQLRKGLRLHCVIETEVSKDFMLFFVEESLKLLMTLKLLMSLNTLQTLNPLNPQMVFKNSKSCWNCLEAMA